MMVIDNIYEIGQVVYLITDKEQRTRIITGFMVRKHGIVYELSLGENLSHHYDFEVSEEENVNMKCL